MFKQKSKKFDITTETAIAIMGKDPLSMVHRSSVKLYNESLLTAEFKLGQWHYSIYGTEQQYAQVTDLVSAGKTGLTMAQSQENLQRLEAIKPQRLTALYSAARRYNVSSASN